MIIIPLHSTLVRASVSSSFCTVYRVTANAHAQKVHRNSEEMLAEEDGMVEAKLQCFTEVVEVERLLADLPVTVKDVRKKEMAQKRFKGLVFMKTYFEEQFLAEILDKYQEQPHLLDIHLGQCAMYIHYIIHRCCVQVRLCLNC